MWSLWNAKLNERIAAGKKNATETAVANSSSYKVENIFYFTKYCNHLSCLQKYAKQPYRHIGHKLHITHARFFHKGNAFMFLFFWSCQWQLVTMLLLLLFRMQYMKYKLARFSTHSIICLKFTTYALYKYRMYIRYNALVLMQALTISASKGEFSPQCTYIFL